MIDRKKVVRAVETCFDSWIDKHRDMGLELHVVEQLKRDALELLKEQEPVEPTREVNENGQILSCGNCRAWFIVQKQKYCHECGRKVKWDDCV